MAWAMLPVPPVVTRPAGVVVLDRFGVQEVEGHGDDLGFELRRARAHVALERVDVGEEPEGLGEEAVMVVVAAVHRPRALSGLPEGVLLLGHRAQFAQDLLARASLLRENGMHFEPIVIWKYAHVVEGSCAKKMDAPSGPRDAGTPPL